jgi:hypothetical protein
MVKSNCIRFAYGVVLAIVVLGVLAEVAVWHFGSLKNISLYLNGQDYVIEPTHIDVGSGSDGEKRTATIHIRNFSFKSICVVGLNTTCNCLCAESLPVVINPRENEEFRFVIILRGVNGIVEQIAVLLFEDDGKMRQTPILISGKCIDEHKEKAKDYKTKGREAI